MNLISAARIFLVATLVLFVVPAVSVQPAHAFVAPATFYPSSAGSPDDCNYDLANTVPSFNTLSTSNVFCGPYGGSTQSISSISVILNYYGFVEGSPSIQLRDYNGGAVLGTASPSLSGGGNCASPNTITVNLNVNPGARAISGHDLELDLNYPGFVVVGSGSCDPVSPTSVTLTFQQAPPPAPPNPCQTGEYCYTAFAVFNVQHSGTPVGGAVVMLSAPGLPPQSLTTSASNSNSLLCTFSPAWAAQFGSSWGCFAGETTQFILVVGVTYSYTVTLPSGTVITGSLVATPAQAWTALMIPIAG